MRLAWARWCRTAQTSGFEIIASTPESLRKGDSPLALVQQMRMVGHLRQKSLDIPEAIPIVQEKISTGLAGLF